MDHVLLADAARTAGEVSAPLILLIIGGLLLFLGLQARKRTRGSKGLPMTIIGGVVIAFAVLGTLGSAAQPVS